MSNKENRKGEESVSGVFHFHDSTHSCSNFVAESGPWVHGWWQVNGDRV